MSKTYVLIEPDEGTVTSVVVAHSKDELLATVSRLYDREIAVTRFDNDKVYHQKNKEKLLEILDNHNLWLNGKHYLPNNWILLILEGAGGFVEWSDFILDCQL